MGGAYPNVGFISLNKINTVGQILLLWGAGLCIMECLASLASTHQVPETLPFCSCDNQKCLQTLPDVPWGTKLSPVENHWPIARAVSAQKILYYCCYYYYLLEVLEIFCHVHLLLLQ